ncbi:glutamine-dependent NAD(+) synthetase-like [Anopheles albimanus]|uniref:Glutamine-dependent NAD(+) synthetase n=1 Tax=Anopheles albimanus TaxID=7167 RepID=A0A182FJL1_ANOAL|nr:glutamine-dependent NAD(+) synthetase-like [Anopheles albimanus]
MGQHVRVVVSTLNQWAMDFQGNRDRILLSIGLTRIHQARYRTGPELEVCGYSCEDHFHEPDTFRHCWEVVLEIMRAPVARDILIDVGMPVQHRNVAYNCRVAFYNGRLVLIRPKMILCDDGNYRESRWFSAWTRDRQTEEYQLPREVAIALGQETVPIGDAMLATLDTCLGYEICEELWTPRSKHIDMSLAGAEILVNGSGSYMQLRKANITGELIRHASYKAGGAYLFSNLRGCDGQRVYFNGCSAVALNGQIIARGRQFALEDVEVTVATFDLQDIRAYRGALRARSTLAAATPAYPRIQLPIELAGSDRWATEASEPIDEVPPSPLSLSASLPSSPSSLFTPEEEIAMGPACWLWDYLRRSGQGGFFLPLSGGVDSSSTAIIVYSMCRLVVRAIEEGQQQVREDCGKILAEPGYVPPSAADLCRRLLFTCYMGTENSSRETRQRAALLATQINCHHMDLNIDGAVSALLGIFQLATGMRPRFRAAGGCARQNLALQNIQARTRMVLAYLFAQLMLWVNGRPGGLLVLGSANVDEALRGYMTKYDCSSADVNPIGGISKQDLRQFLAYAQREFALPIVAEIVAAPPTAELEPLVDGALAQTDEQDMGLTYAELSQFGRLRKQELCGPFSMFRKLAGAASKPPAGTRDPKEIADKVKHFFRCYAINRHKMTVLTPSYHAESYSPDDNRFDHRPFLYRVNWAWQFAAIDAELQQLAASAAQPDDRQTADGEQQQPRRPQSEAATRAHLFGIATAMLQEGGMDAAQQQQHRGSKATTPCKPATDQSLERTNACNCGAGGAAAAGGGDDDESDGGCQLPPASPTAPQAHLHRGSSQHFRSERDDAASIHGPAFGTIGGSLTKSQSTGGGGYGRVHCSVMGKIKDRPGVPV